MAGSAPIHILPPAAAPVTSAPHNFGQTYRDWTWYVNTAGNPTFHVYLKGSLDGVNWTTFDDTTSAGPRVVTNVPYPMVEVQLGAINQGTVEVFVCGY